MCEPEPSRGPSLLAVVGVLAAVAVAAVILKFAESVAEAVALTVFAACAVCVAGLVRLHWPSLVRVFARTPSRQMREVARVSLEARRLRLSAPRQAIAAPRQRIAGADEPYACPHCRGPLAWDDDRRDYRHASMAAARECVLSYRRQTVYVITGARERIRR